MTSQFEVLSQGEEIVTGQVVDTNAAWLSQEAVVLGFTVSRHTAVGDKLEDLVAILSDIALRADACVCTGGLGPTSDDLTAEAVAKAFGSALVFDSAAYEQIERYFTRRGRRMPESNRKQALLPAGSIRLDNHWGTAPGFTLKYRRCRFWFLPGVPYEMREMFAAHVKPMMESRFALQPSRLVTVHSVGIGESELQDRLDKLALPSDVQLGYRAQIGQVQTKLLFPHGFSPVRLEEITRSIANAIGDAVYAIEGLDNRSVPGDLAVVVDRHMQATGKRLAVVETVSGGLLTAKIGEGGWLTCASVYPSTAALAHAMKLQEKTASVTELANAAANKLILATGADIVLLQLAEKNEQGESAVKLSSMLIGPGGFEERINSISGDSNRKQQTAALLSLDFLRRCLQAKRI